MGVGIDIVSVTKIEKVLSRKGEHFLNRVYSARERELAKKLKRPFQFYAGRFAAKEAVFKALDPEFKKKLSFWQIEILRNKDGSPYVSESELLAPNKQISLSISHNDDFAVSMCLVS